MKTAAALALLLMVCPAFAAAPPPPPEAIAWWRFDPARFAAAAPSPEVRAQREALLGVVRSAIAGGAMGDEKALAAVRGLLAASEIGARPHTLSVLDFAAHRPPSGAGVDMDRLQMALAIEAADGHDRFLPTLKSILLPPPSSGSPIRGRQRAFELADGVQAVAYTEPDWEPWREVSWASTPSAFLVGLGTGSLSKAHAEGDAAGKTPWRAHRELVDEWRAEGDVFFEAYLGIARLRDGFPEAFATGRVHRVLSRLGLLHARDLMLHARFVNMGAQLPPIIAIDATFTLPGDTAPQRRALSEDRWPDGVAISPPPGSYVIAAEMDWHEFVTLALDLWLASNVDVDLPERTQALATWRGAHGADLEAFLASLGAYAIVSDYPTPLLPIPGATTVIVPLSGDSKTAGVRLSGALAPFAKIIQTDGAGVSSYAVDPLGLLRMPGWSVVADGPRAVFVAAWSPGAVSGAAAWLRNPITPGTSPTSSPSPTR